MKTRFSCPRGIAWAHDESAQGLVEFAFIAMALVFLFLGTIDFARFMYYDTAIRNAARVGTEAAINGCTNQLNCGRFGSASLNDGILQSAECEASNDGRVSLNPLISCSVCVSTFTGCTKGDPCATAACGTSPQWCAQDMCLQRFNPTAACSGGSTCDPCQPGQGTLTSATSFTSGQCVVLTIGFNFQPIAPILRKFFSTQACWSGDTAAHTLCATSKGLVY